ncbi:MAG: right-handed parallel beta-helix repeat-containing protein [Cellvibrionaceae bacterium]
MDTKKTSVKEFGAKGDGKTDDTKAIQRALDSGDNLRFPRGSYVVSAPLLSGDKYSKPNTAEIIGEHGSIISYSASANNQEGGGNIKGQKSCFNFYSSQISSIFLRGLRISFGNHKHSSAKNRLGTSNGIHIAGYDGVALISCQVTGFNFAGVTIGASGSGFRDINCRNIRILNCEFSFNRFAGIALGNVSNVSIIGNRLNFNGRRGKPGEGYGLAGLSGTIINRVVVQKNLCSDNFRKGIDFHSGQNILISRNSCVRNRMYGIFAAVHTRSAVITHNLISDMKTFRSPNNQVIGVGIGGEDRNELYRAVVDSNSIVGVNSTDGAGLAYPIYISSGADSLILISRNYCSTAQLWSGETTNFVQASAKRGSLGLKVYRNRLRTSFLGPIIRSNFGEIGYLEIVKNTFLFKSNRSIKIFEIRRPSKKKTLISDFGNRFLYLAN